MDGFAPELIDMAIKKRKNIVIIDEPEVPKGFNIVAKPKQPMPAPKMTEAGIHPLRLGLVADSCGFDTDESFTVGDRVKLMRTPYDKKNPQEQRYRNRVKNRGTAITAMCIICTGSRKAVTECLATSCPLWAFRLGSDPFRGTRK